MVLHKAFDMYRSDFTTAPKAKAQAVELIRFCLRFVRKANWKRLTLVLDERAESASRPGKVRWCWW